MPIILEVYDIGKESIQETDIEYIEKVESLHTKHISLFKF